MNTISYAQNYEDVMLLRALREVKHGLYIDVGAQDPIHGSVTKAFYEIGWRGINVEPVARWFKAIVDDRPEDTNLQAVISDVVGEVDFFEIAETGLSTLERRIAKKHENEGHAVKRYAVRSRALDEIIEEYVSGDIHFLKIDVEGAEGSVLNSISLDRYRPWILVVEATEPNSQVPAYADWEPDILDSGYLMVYADGLNRFYLAKERASLAQAFRLPPNYFDFFIPYSEWWAKCELEVRARQLDGLHQELATRTDERDASTRQLEDLAEELRQTTNSLQTADVQLTRLQEEIEELGRRIEHWSGALAKADAEIERLRKDELALIAIKIQLARIEQSHSWRLTAPLRGLRRTLGYIESRLRARLREVAVPIIRFVAAVPGAKVLAKRALANRADLKQRLSVMANEPITTSNSSHPVALHVDAEQGCGSALSESTNEAYVFLKKYRNLGRKVS